MAPELKNVRNLDEILHYFDYIVLNLENVKNVQNLQHVKNVRNLDEVYIFLTTLF